MIPVVAASQTDDRNQIQEQEHIDDDQACNILAMLIGAGADTTSSYLQSFFKVMALHPEVWEKAQAGTRYRLSSSS